MGNVLTAACLVLVVVTPSTDHPSHRAQHPKNGAHDQEEHADRPQEGQRQQKSNQHQNYAKDKHELTPLFVEIVCAMQITF